MEILTIVFHDLCVQSQTQKYVKKNQIPITSKILAHNFDHIHCYSTKFFAKKGHIIILKLRKPFNINIVITHKKIGI